MGNKKLKFICEVDVPIFTCRYCGEKTTIIAHSAESTDKDNFPSYLYIEKDIYCPFCGKHNK